MVPPLKLKKSEKKRLTQLIGAFDQARVLVIGDFMLDQFVWGSVNRISPEAPVPVVQVKRESYMPGGSLNVANNLRTLGATVFPCGVVGRDLEGRLLVKSMRREGIETGGVIYDEERPTAIKTRIIAHSQQVVRFDREDPSDIPVKDLNKIKKFVEKKILKSDVIVVEDYGKGLIQKKFVNDLIQLAKKHKKPVLVDPKEKHFSYYSGATTMTPNKKEAYAGHEGLKGAQPKELSFEKVGWEIMKELKLESLLMTLGEEGMALFEKPKKITRIPTTAREVFDVSGAGDTVIATLASVIAAGGTMREAAKIANIAAGVVVAKLGTATLSQDELIEAIAEF